MRNLAANIEKNASATLKVANFSKNGSRKVVETCNRFFYTQLPIRVL